MQIVQQDIYKVSAVMKLESTASKQSLRGGWDEQKL